MVTMNAIAWRGLSWRRVSLALAWRPEWPVAVLVGIAWLLLALLSLQADGGSSHISHAAHAAHVSPSAALATAPPTWALTSAGQPVWWLMSWLVMSFAMMVPATLPAVRHVAFNSIDARRARAMTIYVAAYLAVWGVFGVVALASIEVGRMLTIGLASASSAASVTSERPLIAIVLAIAAAWQLTRLKRRAIVACRRTVPLPPLGFRADRACARFGVLQAWRCILACWPLMLLMAAMPHPHQLLPMIALTVVVLIEERASNRDRLIIPIACLLAVAAVAAAIAAIPAR